MAITSIKLETDRATYVNWSRTLVRLSESLTVPIRPVGSVAGLPPFPAQISFTGLELLRDVGRACTRPHVMDDPERLFALFRYATKISRNLNNFRLVRDVARLDSHKKKVLSDELGCGFAFLVSGRLLGTTLYLDLCDALDKVARTAPRALQPDYIALQGPHQAVVILEAKGTQSRGYCRSKQIPRGCRQVQSVTIPGQFNSLRIVVGTEFQREGQRGATTVFIGDPEEESPYKYEFAEPIERVVTQAHYLRIASLVGDSPLLDRLREPKEKVRRDEGELIRRSVAGREALGSTLEVRHRQSVTGFFVGLDLAVREQLWTFAPEDLPPSLETPSYREVSGVVDRYSSYASSKDGTVLELWSEGPLREELFLAE